ncbi:uncharacterized protein LOC127847058 isoform X5 [Dreissena polymorpha]|uniref:uncharacterized protein LOC127847058 isoform X5 n=1 Tax=Dreissena polymorpha TaxID=45954 RepID=UPI0022650FC7|nr:uncharacterized protein LOC127847058 isoform X5 [Dreissena polymorpha]
MSGLLRLSPGYFRQNRTRLENMEEEHDTKDGMVECLPGIPVLHRDAGTRSKVQFSSSKIKYGVRRAYINLDPSRQSNNRRDRHLVTSFQIPEHFPALSILLSDQLDDIGGRKCTVMKRRVTYLRRERVETFQAHLDGFDSACFHFGSQSEGTTTPGLNSDIDLLRSYNRPNIMTDWRDWKAGMSNLLMLHDYTTPPQQYLLQVIRRDTPEPETRLCDDRYVRKDSWQVLFSSEQWKKETEQQIKDHGEITKQGPSVSSVPNWDIVNAFHVCQPLPEIQHWIERCRGRHWPPAQLLEAARVAPSFLVPVGHHDSDFKREEWRLSPNLIERMLMFSFNMIQIKCYIVLKLIKQSLFKKMVGEFITSFHCKTVMFYTIERTNPSLWMEDNLMFLILLCLQVLRKWLRLGSLPHYIIEGVNLFDGKLSVVQQRRLLQYVNFLIKNNLQDLFHINIDKLGYRLQGCGIRHIGQAGGVLRRVCLNNSISLMLTFERLESFLIHLRYITYQVQNPNAVIEQNINSKLRTCFEHSRNLQMQKVALEIINHLYALRNSMQSSKSLRLRNHVFSVLIRRFKYSLNTDVASNRLKLASVLYCCGHLQAAVRVLEDVERSYQSMVKAVCGCRRKVGDRDLQVFANMISDNCDNKFCEPQIAFCVKFVREEAYCAPYILWFEMNRNMTEEEVVQRDYVSKQWMDCAELDALPFLHYLQYLTYGGLGERDKQLHAFGILESYIYDPRNNINMYHYETALNLLGHCYEMEGYYEEALYYYEKSLRQCDTNNAANWHVQRVQRLISN